MGDVIPTLTPEDVGTTGFLLLFAQKRSTLTRPFLRVPDSRDWTFLFDILTSASAPGQDPAFVERMLARNRRWFEAARRVGGTRYPISAIPFNRGDWARQYDGVFPDLVQAQAPLRSRRHPDARPRHLLIRSPRPAKRGERLSCESSGLPSPGGAVADNRVEDGEQLSHASDESDLG